MVYGQVNLRVLRAVDVVCQWAGAAPRSRRSAHVEIVGVEEAQRRLLQLDALGASTAVAAAAAHAGHGSAMRRVGAYYLRGGSGY